MEKHLSSAKGRLSQRGINMVDLMMWLVIAALLLAAALQGIGYYQKASYLYSMKNDASNAGTASMAQVTNEGKITEEAVAQGTDDTKKTTNIDTVAQEGADDATGFVIRSSSPSVPDQDVLFLSHQRGAWAPGIHVVPKDTVIDGTGLTTIVPGGNPIVVTPPGDGGSGGGTVGSGVTSVIGMTVPEGISQPLVDYYDADLAFLDSASMERYIVGDATDYNAEQTRTSELLAALTPEEDALRAKIDNSPNNDPAIMALSQDVTAKQQAYFGAMQTGTAEDKTTARAAFKEAMINFLDAAFIYGVNN